MIQIHRVKSSSRILEGRMWVVWAAVGVTSHVARSKKTRWKSVVDMRKNDTRVLSVKSTPRTPPYPPTGYETHAWSTRGPPV